jgi:hypothetical protein
MRKVLDPHSVVDSRRNDVDALGNLRLPISSDLRAE